MSDSPFWDVSKVEPPWGDRPSLFAHVRDHIVQNATGLAEGAMKLPDEERLRDRGGLSWVAGGLDGAFGHHAGSADGSETAATIFAALREFTEKSSSERAAALYALLTEHSALDHVDPLLEAVYLSDDLDPARVRIVARWLAGEAADREPVKVGIALLGLFPAVENRDLLLTLGGHDEFTLYTAVALVNASETAERDLFELARHVDGWGRIQLVERLAGTRDEEIKGWMLREGYKNTVMYEYTAYVCATSGGLLDALRAPHPDEALLEGAGEILAALVTGLGGPAEGIDEYQDGAEATELWLGHLQDGEVGLKHLVAVGEIRSFLEGETEKQDPAPGWVQRQASLTELIRAILSRPELEHRVREGLTSRDAGTFWAATGAARVLGIDTWETYFRRLREGEPQWYFVMQTDDPERVDRVVSLAEQRLPLDRIGSGPADELGLGPGFGDQSALGFVLQDLGRFPGKGWPLIRAGLQSPVTRNRNMALRALGTWDKDEWPSDAGIRLQAALEQEPNEHTREQIRRVLAGESLED